MCCTVNNQRCQRQDRSFQLNHAHCGCGCMGNAQTISRLEEIKSGLKAELECVENRLGHLRKD